MMAKGLGDPKVCQRFLGQFTEQGIAPEQLIMRRNAPIAAITPLMPEVDIVLDPFPRTGGTTTADALWMGCRW